MGATSRTNAAPTDQRRERRSKPCMILWLLRLPGLTRRTVALMRASKFFKRDSHVGGARRVQRAARVCRPLGRGLRSASVAPQRSFVQTQA